MTARQMDEDARAAMLDDPDDPQARSDDEEARSILLAEATVGVPRRSPEKVREGAQRVLREFRKIEAAWFERATRNLDAPSPQPAVQCKKGCTHCCYQLTLGTLVSGVLIADHLIRTAQLDVLERVKEQGDFQGLMLRTHGYPEAATVYFRDHHQPCALLGSDGLCLVYDLRPPCCSTYYVVSDPGLCAKADAVTMVGSLDNNMLHGEALMADAEFKAWVTGEQCDERSLILGPLGILVDAGQALLGR